MKRYGLVSLIMLGIFIITAGVGVHAAQQVQNSKHNLSTTGPGPIQSSPSGGTSEICVFCHTPHGSAGASFQAPLWNKNFNTPAYQVYISDVLSQLTYPAAEQPLPSVRAVHLKSKLCLTCHDGTIALGTLANWPSGYVSDIPMVRSGSPITNMPDTAEGYIGLDLQDDHPIAIPHTPTGAGSDPELKSQPFATKVRLYPEGGIDYVECTSCHDPHEITNPKFLVDSNLNSKICTTCHRKETGSGTSAHDNSTVNYNPDGTGSIGTQVGTAVSGVFCMNCHYPHKSGVTSSQPTTPNNPSIYGKYLLTFQEEQSCFNNTNRWGNPVSSCHGTAATKNIQSLVSTKASAHKVGTYGGYSGRHKATEIAFNWLSTSQWHVECSDCHNSHTAGITKHTPGTNVIGNNSPLYGAGGVTISSWPAVGMPLQAINVTPFESLGTTTSTSMPLNYYEYQICLKCHSSFAWNGGAIPSPPASMTDQAIEFNANNVNTQSYHPVVQANPNRYLGLPAASLTGGFTPGNTMYCSDCHGNDNPVEPKGPHGSGTQAILYRPYNPVNVGQNNTELCFGCHAFATYQGNLQPITNSGFRDATRNLHYEHMNPAGAFAYQGGVLRSCTNCHVNPTHGINRYHLIAITGVDGPPYATYSYTTNYTHPAPGSYIGTSCSTVTCHAGTVHGPG